MKIYFVTHSTTTDSEAGLASGWSDTGLSETGIRQAGELGGRFKNIKLDLIYCSDLPRAVETEETAFRGKIPVVTDKKLREIDCGELTGKPAEIVKPMDNKWIDGPFPAGESYRQAVARVHDFLRGMIATSKEKTVLVVGHRATQFGLDTYTGIRRIEECLSVPFRWQPYWEYEF